MRRSHKVAAAALAVVAITSACNSKLLRPPAIIFVDSGEFAVRTTIREEGRRYPSVFLAYLPSKVPLHASDEVNFQLQDTGEPHTVAMGTLIDAAVQAAEALGPSASLRQLEGLKEMKKVPSVFPGALKGEVPKVNPSAAERCFLDEGAPSKATCADTDQPDFSGRQAFFSSGVLEEGEPFRITVAPNASAGTYRFMCLVHRSAMTGALEVRPKDAERPAVADLRTEADNEEGEVASSLEPAARVAGVAAFDAKGKGPVLAATGPRGLSRAFIAAFIGDEVKAAVGEEVVWNVHRTHTISFRPSRDAKEGLVIDDDGGGVKVNEDAWTAVGSTKVPADVYRVPPTKKSFAIDGGTWSGEGEWSSGVIRATPPTKVTYTMRFSAPGTYAYSCLIHPSMRGKVIVE